VAAGRAIVPSNINHPELEPMIIGRNFLVKINANIGNSAVASSIEEEVEKMPLGHQVGPDTVMIYPPARTFTHTRMDFLRNSPCRSAPCRFIRRWKIVGGKAGSDWEIFRDTLIEQDEQMCGLFHHSCRACCCVSFHSRRRRMTGIVRRAAEAACEVVPFASPENFLYTHGTTSAHHGRLRRFLFHRRRPAPRLIADANDEARSVNCRCRRIDRRAWAKGRSSYKRRSRPRADAHDRGEHGQAT